MLLRARQLRQLYAAARSTPLPPSAFPLGDRCVLRLRGADTLSYLQARCALPQSAPASASLTSRAQGLVTNDVRSLADAGGARAPRVREQHSLPADAPSAAPLYTALLNSTGRLLFDAFLHPSGHEGGEEVLLEAASESRDTLLRHLARFRLRAAVAVEDVSADYCVWSAPPGTAGWPRDPRLAVRPPACAVHPPSRPDAARRWAVACYDPCPPASPSSRALRRLLRLSCASASRWGWARGRLSWVASCLWR